MTAQHVALDCGCRGWSSDQPNLIVSYCPRHFALNEARQAEMRERSRKRSKERIRFTPEQIEVNLARMEA
jgi:hypothetical protein